MNSFSKFFLLFGITMVMFTSCDKKDDDNPDDGNNNQNSATGMMTCKVDGVDWTASLAVVGSMTESAQIATATGSDSNAKQCQITLTGFTGTGDYDLGGTLTNPNTGRWTAGLNPEDTYTTQLGQGTGKVTVTEATATGFKGTFYFTAKNMSGAEVSITDGTFEVTYQ